MILSLRTSTYCGKKFQHHYQIYCVFSLVTDSLYPSGPSPMAAGLYMGLACCLGNRKSHCNIKIFFSSPEPKVQMSFYDQNLPVVGRRRCCCRRCFCCCQCEKFTTTTKTTTTSLKLFIVFSRITGPISTKLGTKHLWVKGIHICSNEGPRPIFHGK